MSRLKIYDPSASPESIARERSLAYLRLSSREKIEQLLSLIEMSVSLNQGKPIKEPMRKGIVISRKKQ